MRVSLSKLEAFYWTARLGSVRAAAQHLNLTQPTLSLRIKELERVLGLTLFDRGGQRMRLTHHGASIRRHAEQMLSLAGHIERYGRSAIPSQSLLRIGAADIFAVTCLPRLLRSLEQSHPNVVVEVSVAFSHSIGRMLAEGTLDVAFLTDIKPVEGLHTRLLGDIDIAWMAAPEFGLGGRVLRPVDLAEFHIISNPAPSHLYRSIQDWFASEEVWPARVSTCNTLSGIAQLALAGVGVAMLPVAFPRFDPWASGLRVLRAEPMFAAHKLYAAHRESDASDDIAGVIAEAASLAIQTGILGEVGYPQWAGQS